MRYTHGRIMLLTLVGLLTVSVVLNLYFWSALTAYHHEAKSPTDVDGQTSSQSNFKDEFDNATLQDSRQSAKPCNLEVSGQNSENAQTITENEINIDQLYQYLRDENWPMLTVTVREFLKQSPDNIDALLIEAELIARTEPLAIALVHYYSLLDRALNSEQHKAITEKIQQLFENATEQLRFDRAWDLLAELLEPLVQIAPNERRYLILLAEAYAQQANAVMMENALAGLDSDDPAIASIRTILLRNQDSDNDSNTDTAANNPLGDSASNPSIMRIQLDRIGNQYIVETGVDGRPIRLMIDTGASITAITTAAWARLSQRIATQFIGVFKVNTAAGFIEAPMFKVKSFTLGSLRFDDVSIMVIPSRMMGDDLRTSPQGLLGMNILSNVNFQIDQQSAELLLSPRK